MTWTTATLWWLAAGGLVIAELLSGTFYLLMLALGTAAGAAAAHAGLALEGQMAAAALVGGGAVGLWHQRRRRQPQEPRPQANRDVNLDIGQTVHVGHWRADGGARVHHRGAAWDARHVGPGTPAPGEHVIQAIEGACLMLVPVPARAADTAPAH